MRRSNTKCTETISAINDAVFKNLDAFFENKKIDLKDYVKMYLDVKNASGSNTNSNQMIAAFENALTEQPETRRPKNKAASTALSDPQKYVEYYLMKSRRRIDNTSNVAAAFADAIGGSAETTSTVSDGKTTQQAMPIETIILHKLTVDSNRPTSIYGNVAEAFADAVGGYAVTRPTISDSNTTQQSIPIETIIRHKLTVDSNRPTSIYGNVGEAFRKAVTQEKNIKRKTNKKYRPLILKNVVLAKLKATKDPSKLGVVAKAFEKALQENRKSPPPPKEAVTAQGRDDIKWQIKCSLMKSFRHPDGCSAITLAFARAIGCTLSSDKIKQTTAVLQTSENDHAELHVVRGTSSAFVKNMSRVKNAQNQLAS